MDQPVAAKATPNSAASFLLQELGPQYPQLGNGFTLVTDRRPAGLESRPIPYHQFATYLSNSQVPLAAYGHQYFAHDQVHIQSYKKMFDSIAFAGLVKDVSVKSLQQPTDTMVRILGRSFDDLGNAMILLADTPDRQVRAGVKYVKMGIDNLQTLLVLHIAGVHTPPDQLVLARSKLFSTIWYDLGLQQHQDRFNYVV
jgi:hypothetical protein